MAAIWLTKQFFDEVEQLQGVSGRLEGPADQTPSRATEELLANAGNVRSVATLLAVLIATKLHGQRRAWFVSVLVALRWQRLNFFSGAR
jgi:hypothetical protein